MERQEKAYLDAAAEAVWRQVEENPEIGIPVDPDVADHMGLFFCEEKLEEVLEGKLMGDGNG